jgi:hypothetical protein
MSNTLHSKDGSVPPGNSMTKIALFATAGVVLTLATVTLVLNLVSPLNSIDILPNGTAPEKADKILRDLSTAERNSFALKLKQEVQERPLNVEPIKKLAALAQTGTKSSDGNDLVMLAANRVWRDVSLQSAALQLELEQKNYAAAIYRLNIIFHTQPEKEPEVLKILAGLTSPESLQALVDALAKEPKWRKAFLLDVSASPAVNPDTVYNLFSAMRKAGSPANQGELRSFLQRLITTGAEDKAYFVWLDSIDQESLKRAALIHDGGFDLPLTNQFFSWTAYKVPNVDARTVPRGSGSVDKVLRIDFAPARTAYNNFVQLLNLAPGSYVLTGEAKADNLVSPVGLVWRINCTSGPIGVLGETKPISGNLQWSVFETSFTVPDEGCRSQTIRIQVNAKTDLDAQISGQAQFDNLAITRKKQ